MMFTRNLKQLSKKDTGLAGGKGSSLGEMIKNKTSVPPGFVVLSNTFDNFLEKNNLDAKIQDALKKVRLDNIHSVEMASKKIKGLILTGNLPKNIITEIQKEFSKLKTKSVAVRSSATAEDSSSASWAGELESYLNTTKSNLINNIKRCWASLFSQRAIIYRFGNKLNKQRISVAVVIQKMIQSEVSGVAFTTHPVTQNRDQIIIEAGYGLGEAIVGGKITPDAYIIQKNKKVKILEKTISKQSILITRNKRGTKEKTVLKSKQSEQKLTNKQILKLAKICINIEKHYKKPQDIEWAFEKGRFYIVQSRPITTLD